MTLRAMVATLVAIGLLLVVFYAAVWLSFAEAMFLTPVKRDNWSRGIPWVLKKEARPCLFSK